MCGWRGDGQKNLISKNFSRKYYLERHLDQLIKAGDYYRDLEQEFDTSESNSVTTHQSNNSSF